MTEVRSENVITALRKQLSEAHLRIAMLEAQLVELGQMKQQAQPVLVVPDVPAEQPGSPARGAVR